jgi:hypothetical protein
MQVDKIFAVVSSADLEKSREWYSRLFGREPDETPMQELRQWHFEEGGVQLLDDAQHAGQSMLTLIIEDLESARADLASRGLSLGPASSSDYANTAQIRDLDGNLVTLAQPGSSQAKPRSQRERSSARS